MPWFAAWINRCWALENKLKAGAPLSLLRSGMTNCQQSRSEAENNDTGDIRVRVRLRRNWPEPERGAVQCPDPWLLGNKECKHILKPQLYQDTRYYKQWIKCDPHENYRSKRPEINGKVWMVIINRRQCLHISGIHPVTRAGQSGWRGTGWSSARIVVTWLRTWWGTWSTWRRRDTSTRLDSWHTGLSQLYWNNFNLRRNLESQKIGPPGWRSGIIPLKRLKKKIPGRWHSMKRRKLKQGVKPYVNANCENLLHLNPLMLWREDRRREGGATGRMLRSGFRL